MNKETLISGIRKSLTLGIIGVLLFNVGIYVLQAKTSKKNQTIKITEKTWPIAPTKTAISAPPANNTEDKKDSLMESVDQDWNLYKNYKLGFSLKIPKRSDGEGAVKILEQGNLAFIVGENSEKFETVKSRLKTNESDFKKVDGLSWAFISKEIKSEKDIEEFIKEKYGRGCVVEGKTPLANQSEAYDIEIKATDPEGGCFINYITVTRYYPKKNVLVSWDMGQDASFFFDVDSGKTADIQMLESFRFLD